MKKVMSFGTFDFLHPGHLSYLKQAQKYGDYMIVVVARDRNVLKIKKRLPEQNEKARLTNLKKASIADKVILGQVRDKFAIIRKYEPDIICLGYDQAVNFKKLKEIFNGKIIRLQPYKKNIYKSSKLIKVNGN
jgi:FAD synthetase